MSLKQQIEAGFTFTIHNTDNGKWTSYWTTPAQNGTKFFVNAVTETGRKHRYCGVVFSDDTYRWTAKSYFDKDSVENHVFAWLWRQLCKGKDLPENVEILPSKKCSWCDMWLTSPDSIRRGIGPVCAKRLAERGL